MYKLLLLKLLLSLSFLYLIQNECVNADVSLIEEASASTSSSSSPSPFTLSSAQVDDDSALLQEAINQAIAKLEPFTLHLQPRTYFLRSTLNIVKAKDLAIVGSGTATLLLMQTSSSAIYYDNCYNLTLRAFSIDYETLPFTAGVVVDSSAIQHAASASHFLDVRIAPPHEAQINHSATAIFRYDVQAQRPAFGLQTLELYQSNAAVTSLVSDEVLRVPLVNDVRFNVGDAVVVRLEGGPHCITGGDSINVAFRSITVYTAYDMAHAANRDTNKTVIDFHVKKNAGRWLSTQADCLHLSDHRGFIVLLNSSCEGMGDDGLNIHAFFFNVSRVVDQNTAEITLYAGKAWPATLDVDVGTSFTFSHASTPFTPFAVARIVNKKSTSDQSWIFTFDQKLVLSVNDTAFVGQFSAPMVHISNFTVANNRARGMLLEAHNVHVEQCLFNQTSGSAVLLQPSLFWGEAPVATNISITQTTFLSCNLGIAQQEGVISLLPDPIQSIPVFNNISIFYNTFYHVNDARGILQITNARNLTFTHNIVHWNNNQSTPFYLCNSNNITLYNNTLLYDFNRPKLIYTLDDNNICHPALSTNLYLDHAFDDHFHSSDRSASDQNESFRNKKSIDSTESAS